MTMEGNYVILMNGPEGPTQSYECDSVLEKIRDGASKDDVSMYYFFRNSRESFRPWHEILAWYFSQGLIVKPISGGE